MRSLGVIALLVGLLPMLIAFDVLPVPPDSIRAPRWVLFVAGALFVLAGCMALLQSHKRLLDALAGIVLLMFSAIGSWAALLAPADGFSGGLPFLPRDTNVSLGRVLFGVGALMTFACAIYAFRLAIRGRR